MLQGLQFICKNASGILPNCRYGVYTVARNGAQATGTIKLTVRTFIRQAAVSVCDTCSPNVITPESSVFERQWQWCQPRQTIRTQRTWYNTDRRYCQQLDIARLDLA